jgi:hypothetical protein
MNNGATLVVDSGEAYVRAAEARGNDKNIAVLLRYFHGLPLDHVTSPSPR